MRAGIRSLIAVAALIASATLTLFTDNARALGPASCNAYADRAVAQAQLAQAKKCGFGVSETGNAEHPGPAWSVDRNAYIRECRKWTSEDTPKERNGNRDRLLGECEDCNAYAAEASKRASENVKFSCGFSGPQWDTNYQAQFNYCMANYNLATDGPTFEGKYGGPYYKSNERNREREEGMKACKDQFTPEQIALCHTYSEKAREQAAWNRQNKCGDAKGSAPVGRWTMNSDHHFAFCTAGFKRNEDEAIKAAMKAEEAAREEANKMCIPNIIRKRPNDLMTTRDPNMLKPIPSTGPSPFGGKSRQSDRAKAGVKPAAVAVPRSKSTLPATSEKPAATSSSAMDRIAPGATSASGGSYQSKGGAPAQTRSSGGAGSGGAGTPSGGFVGPNLRMSPGGGNIKQDTFKGGQVN